MRRLSFPLVLFIVGALSGAGCKNEGAPGSAPGAGSSGPSRDAPVDPLDKAEAAAKKLGGAVRQRLVDSINTGGPARALEVCSAEAQGIAKQVREETGVLVGRASLRLRNEADAPPPWVDAWLKTQGERKAEGVQGTRSVEVTPAGRVARVIKPIVIEATCLPCHGDPSSLKDDVKALLAARYPNDKATGYSVGDLRGALWAELPIRD